MAGWKPHENLEESEKILSSFIEGQEVWAIEEKASGKVVGSIGLHPDHCRTLSTVRMLGYALSAACWGKGYMPEAIEAVLCHGFTKMGLSLVSVGHFPFNSRSKRVIEKCGFQYEGTRRLAFERFDGVVLDECCYSMTKDEYEKGMNRS